jgi:hypothetical protein
MARLQELEVVEVSFVDLPANKRKFLVTKNHGGNTVEELLALILETDLENEAEIDQALSESDLDEQGQQALKGAIKLLNAHRESLTPALVKSMLTKAGFVEAEEPTPEAEVLLKEDGTLNLESVPEALHPALQALWDKGRASQDERDELEKTLKAERSELRKSEYIQKATDLKLPGASVDEFGDVLMKAADALPDEFPILDKVLAAVSALIKDSKTLEELGNGNESEGQSAYDRASSIAKEMVKADPSLTIPVAINKAFENDRELAEQHAKEEREG